MTISLNTKKVISDIKKQLSIIDLIPASFDSNKTPFGIDRDFLEETISEYESECLSGDEHAILKEFINDKDTLKDYIDLFYDEIKNVNFLQYTNPKSVHYIMDIIGTKGVLNTDNGLCIFQDETELKLQKTEWLVIHGNQKYKIENKEKDLYDNFLKLF